MTIALMRERVLLKTENALGVGHWVVGPRRLATTR